MGVYPRPNCPNHPSPEELSMVEVDAQIHKLLDLGVSPNPGVGHVPLQRLSQFWGTNTLLVAFLTVCSLILAKMHFPCITCVSVEFLARGMPMWTGLM
jgi:hypothetical protein